MVSIVPLSTAVTNVASLIGCSEQELVLALSTRKVQAGKDEVTRRMTLQQVKFLKNLYSLDVYHFRTLKILG